MLFAYITSKNSFLPRVYFKFFSVVQFHPHINLRRNTLLLFLCLFIFKYSYMMHCITWGPRRARGRGRFGGLFSIFTMGDAIASPTVKCFRFVSESLTTFPFGIRIVGKLDSWASGDVFSFKINVGVYEKLAQT